MGLRATQFRGTWACNFKFVRSGFEISRLISIRNSMICSDIWHKYYE